MGQNEPFRFLPLCYRCEYRALFHETGAGPRYECSLDTAVCGCYMYRPVVPLVIESDSGDNRPLGGPSMISARSHAVSLGDCELVAHRIGRLMLAYWTPRSKSR